MESTSASFWFHVLDVDEDGFLSFLDLSQSLNDYSVFMKVYPLFDIEK